MSAMKPLPWLALSLFLAVSCPSQAQSNKQAEAREWCGLVSQYAASVMGARQANADAAELMEIAAGDSGKIEPWKESLITWAYEIPRYSAAEFKDNATRDFKNKAYLSCLKGNK